MAVDGVHEPQRAVGGVVLQGAGVGRVGQHALGDRAAGPQQRSAALVVAAGGEEQALVRGHRVARPLAEPRVAGRGGGPAGGGDDELVGGEHELRLHVVDRVRRLQQARRPGPRGRDDLHAGRRLVAERRGPGLDRDGLARCELGAEAAGGPHVLAVAEAALRLRAQPDAGVPLAAGRPAGAADAVGALEDRAVVEVLDRGRPPGEALAVGVAPGAERRELQPHRPAPGQQAVHDGDAGAAVRHRELALDDRVADLPAPARKAVDELEGHELLVTRRIDRSARPLVRRQAMAAIAGDDDGVERGEPHATGRHAVHGHDQQRVVAARPQAGDGAHRVAAHAVGEQPLARGGGAEVAADLPSEGDAHGSTPFVGRRQMRSATSPVQPVWWVAPRPAPLSPWKYSLNIACWFQSGSSCRRCTQP